jgi:hypothetical protein
MLHRPCSPTHVMLSRRLQTQIRPMRERWSFGERISLSRLLFECFQDKPLINPLGSRRGLWQESDACQPITGAPLAMGEPVTCES